MSIGEIRVSSDGSKVEVIPGTGGLSAVQDHLRTQGIKGVKRVGQRVQFDFAGAADLLNDGESYLTFAKDARLAVENRARVKANASSVQREISRLEDEGVQAQREALSDSRLATDLLDDHQLENVSKMTVPDGWGACIFDEQGTGKTLTVIAAFDVLAARNEADVMLVIAPKSMVPEWGVEFERFTKDLYSVAIAEGTRAEKAGALMVGADVIVMNYESAISLKSDIELLARKCRVVLVVDESFNVKNPEARRTSAISEIRESCARCFVLCGTPAPNAPTDLVAQFDLVDFAFTFGEVVLSDDPERQRDQIRDAMEARGVYTRNLKLVVLPELPVKQFTRIPVELAPIQRNLYENAAGELAEDLAEVSEEQFAREYVSFLERRNALLRICSNPTAVQPDYDELPGKLRALDQLLPTYMDAGEKVVVWSYYRASLDALASRYEQFGLARIDGSVSDMAERRDAVQRFQNDDATRLFLGNPAAAGAGLTLHRARIAIYESMSNQAAHFMQSLDRIHRRGQARDVEYVMLLCSGTIEEPEYQRLLDKTDAQADVLGDPVPIRPTREMMLREIEGISSSP